MLTFFEKMSINIIRSGRINLLVYRLEMIHMSVKINSKMLCLFLAMSFIVTGLMSFGLFCNVLFSNATTEYELLLGYYSGTSPFQSGQTVEYQNTNWEIRGLKTDNPGEKTYEGALNLLRTGSEYEIELTLNTQTGVVEVKIIGVRRQGTHRSVNFEVEVSINGNELSGEIEIRPNIRGHVNVTYQGIVFEPQAIEVSKGEREWIIHDWVDSIVVHNPNGDDPDFSFDYVEQSDEDAITISGISADGALEFEILEITTTGSFEFIVTESSTPGYPLERKFFIEVSEPPDSSFSPSVFDAGVGVILDENDLDTLLDYYSDLIERAPSNDALGNSFEEVLDEIGDRYDFSELDQKDIDRLKTKASRVNTIASTIEVPSYSFNGVSYAEIEDEDVVEIQAKFGEILDYNKRLNTVLERNGFIYELEPLLNLEGVKIRDDDVVKLVLPSKLEDEIFDSGFLNISIDTHNAKMIFKENTLYYVDPFDPVAQEDTPDRPKQIMFRAERLPQDNSFDLKVFFDGLEYKDFYGVSQKDFERELSVHLPLEHNDEDTMHLLKVEHFKDGDFINKGGMYNQAESEMRFDTESFSIFIITTSNRSFNDIDGTNSEWSKRFVESLAARGIVDGVADGNEFKPAQNITRAETAIMIANSFKLLEHGLRNPFTDVDDSDIFAPHVSSLFKHRIVTGGGEGKFYPNNEIKRQDAAIMIANTLLERHQSTLKLPSNPESYLDKFNDKDDISDYAKRHVAFLSALNILGGDLNGNLNPIGKITRAELSTILYRSLQLKNIQGLPYDIRPEGVGVS